MKLERSFCPRCGNPSRPLYPDRPLAHQRCDACGHTAWRNPLPVAGALVVRDGRVLLTRRHAAADRGADRWAYPGGFVEAGETAEEGAVRETLEEAGLEVRLTGLVGRTYSVRDPSHLVIAYRAEADGEPRALDETAEVRWFAPDEVPWAELAFPSTGEALRDLLAEGLDGPPAHPLEPRHGLAEAPPFEHERHCERCGGLLVPLEGARPGRGHAVCSSPECASVRWRNPVTGAAAWVVRDGHVLLARRSASVGNGAGMWDGPAGHMELGETAEETLHREAMEELGIRVQILGLNGVFSLRERPVVFVSYATTTEDEPTLSDEVSELRWVTRQDIPWSEVFEDGRETLRMIIQRGYL